MRIIVISDIHGHYNEFLELLSLVNYIPNKDILYLLGDYVDKGLQSKETVQYVMELSKHPNVKVIGGNHDSMLLNYLDGNDYRLMPYAREQSGGTPTLLSFCPFFKSGVNDNEVRQFIKENYSEEINFLRELPFYIEDEFHIYVHAGINPKEDNWKNTSQKDFRWIRKHFFDTENPHDKTVVFGHTSCAELHKDKNKFDVWFSKKKIGIDGGIKFGGQLNALIIEDGLYQTYYVKTKEAI